MTLADVDRFIVPPRVILETEEALRSAGARGHELFVLWTGRFGENAFDVRTSHVPRQSSYRLSQGLLVRVEAHALHQLNAWLFEQGEMLGVQIHAHPDAAYHSRTDEAYPIVTTLGGLSLVAERFCADDLLARGSAAYRLKKRGWTRLTRRRLLRTICISD